MYYRTRVRKKTVVLTMDFAGDFNSQVGKHLGSHIVLLDLIKDIMQISGKVKRTHRSVRYEHEGKLLADYLAGISHQQSASLMRVIKITRRGLFKMFTNLSHEQITVGLLRNFDSEALESIYGLNKASAKFIQTAFAKE